MARNKNQYRGYNFSQLGSGYKFHYDYPENPIKTVDKNNRIPRNFSIHCKTSFCIWNTEETNKESFGNCDRYEAWNILKVSELEVGEDGKEQCPWYSGRNFKHVNLHGPKL